MKDLAEAQNRTETRVEELAEAQKELAEAQKRTEKAMGELAVAHKSLAQQMGGLSNILGGDLEDIAHSLLFHFLPDQFGWQIGQFEHVWKDWGGKTPDEIDIFARATDSKPPNVPIWIVGEAKYNLTIQELKHFMKLIERARQYLEGEVFPLCFCYRARPEVQQLAKETGIRILFSYGKMI